MTRRLWPAALAFVIVFAAQAAAAASFRWSNYADKPDDWFRGAEAARVAANVLSHQSKRGDWPKNVDTGARPADARSSTLGTFDNGATVGEIRFLARMFRVTGKPEYRDAALKGLDHVLEAQYPNGGWPQLYPPGKGYARLITFNDGTVQNLMELVRDVGRSDDFAFAGPERREAARRAFARAVHCVLNCQIKVGGVLTVWCAQHEEVTLEPLGARTFELASLSGAESAGLLMLLMSLENPSPEVVRAVDAGARWFEKSRLTGIRQVTVDGNKVIERDASAPPVWARFYEIETNRPFFCGRDGVKKYDIAEIEAERRNGYAWYGNWGDKVAKRYAKWKVGRRP